MPKNETNKDNWLDVITKISISYVKNFKTSKNIIVFMHGPGLSQQHDPWLDGQILK